MTDEYFLNVGDMILCVTTDDFVRERHFDGVTVTGTSVTTQKYYSPFSETEEDYKPATGKEILCYLEASRSGGGQFASVSYRVWASPVKDDKADAAARDVFGKNFSVVAATPISPLILRAGEYLNVGRVSGSATGVVVTKIVGVERDAVP